ncbi:helix-turn-helix domain-containing protein [Brevibacillus laterosporus]|uniref:Helix-turn-helix transcriptional regulator n=1 Tax=Brevibacillus laterosporus TaxID=1465 RepID=A0AAP3DJM0_BRELA|nr:helix-turn-helix transcriptional regulator [Brevibacillus laterosporus]MCR8982533.1 helix-turn-helix domain-containing protein [Brevibacillus laterosporus]MCZ0809689.1 helix-turn-helix transcriptional regulator [Brevibacillus laterosporus]MCZ0828222.1 helix-turn-helix transcriptional regulator [Brevibacillus laterosporus]MCZ0852244.1 helix-turn-helix transcriptional regulator [Brevibacillus laterosporus]
MESLNWLNQLEPSNDAEWLVLARKKLGLTQGELSIKTKYSAITISKIENGKTSMTPYFKQQMSVLLKEKEVM